MKSLRPALSAPKKALKARHVSFRNIVRTCFRSERTAATTTSSSSLPKSKPSISATTPKQQGGARKRPSPSVPSLIATPGASPMRAKILFSKKRNHKRYFLVGTALVLYTNYLRTHTTEEFQKTRLDPGTSVSNKGRLLRYPTVSKFLEESTSTARRTLINNVSPACGRMWQDYQDQNTFLLESDTSAIVDGGKRALKRIRSAKDLASKTVVETSDSFKTNIVPASGRMWEGLQDENTLLLESDTSEIVDDGKRALRHMKTIKDLASKAVVETTDSMNKNFVPASGRMWEGFQNQNTFLLESDISEIVNDGRKYLKRMRNFKDLASKAVVETTTDSINNQVVPASGRMWEGFHNQNKIFLDYDASTMIDDDKRALKRMRTVKHLASKAISKLKGNFFSNGRVQNKMNHG